MYTKIVTWFSIILIVLCLTMKNVDSITCYACENCVSVDGSTPTETNCGGCVKTGVPKIYVKRYCAPNCTDIATNFPIKDLLSCCSTDLCNNSRQLKPFIIVGLIVYSVWYILTSH
ncbi:unnamed protein product [Schistosoma turkestanicum]|nr:unnamed protein product [Schistosoma turkestanicum]